MSPFFHRVHFFKKSSLSLLFYTKQSCLSSQPNLQMFAYWVSKLIKHWSSRLNGEGGWTLYSYTELNQTPHKGNSESSWRSYTILHHKSWISPNNPECLVLVCGWSLWKGQAWNGQHETTQHFTVLVQSHGFTGHVKMRSTSYSIFSFFYHTGGKVIFLYSQNVGICIYYFEIYFIVNTVEWSIQYVQ